MPNKKGKTMTNLNVQEYKIADSIPAKEYTSKKKSCSECKHDPSYDEQKAGIVCKADGDCVDCSLFVRGKKTESQKARVKGGHCE